MDSGRVRLGRSSKILGQSGDEVKPESVLLVLTNPQMEADADDYEWQTKQAEANLCGSKSPAAEPDVRSAIHRRGQRRAI